MELLIWVLEQIGIPSLILIGGLLIEHFWGKRKERNNMIPKMYTLKLCGRKETQLVEEKIRKNRHIITLSNVEYPALDNEGEPSRSISFQEISYKELLKLVEKQEIFLLGFENIDNAGLSLKHVITDQGIKNDMDRKEVPPLLDKDTSYCLVCKIKDIPASIQGDFLGQPVQYMISNTEGVRWPRMKSKK